jgi:hypothetical protein
MTYDSINDEILRIKRELASKFDNDLARIVADTRSQEKDAISMPKRSWRPEQYDTPKPPVEVITNDVSSPADG